MSYHLTLSSMTLSSSQALIHLPHSSTPKINQAMIVTGNTIEYVSNCLDCPHRLIIADSDPRDSWKDKERSLMCPIHTKWEAGQKQVLHHERTRDTRDYELSSFATITAMEEWDFMLRKFAAVPDWCKLQEHN